MHLPVCSMRRQLKSYLYMMLLSTVIVLIAHFGMPYLNEFYSLKGWSVHMEYAGYICWGTALSEAKVKNIGDSFLSDILFRKFSSILSMLGIFFFVASEALSG